MSQNQPARHPATPSPKEPPGRARSGSLRRLLAGVTLAAVSTQFTAAVDAAPSQADIDDSIERAMSTFEVPGMAVAVVQNGETYYSGGSGIRQTGAREPVDDHTLFQIASLTKAFTTAAIAILVDEGKVAWDNPVIDYLPEFRMSDPWVTREFTVRDMLTHRSGLPKGAGELLLFPDTNTTVDEIIRAMRYLKPSSSFRSEFAYDNLLYIISGQLIAQVSGMPFADFLEQRLLQPLGMGDCRATLARVPDAAAVATPHLLIDGELQTTLSLESSLASPTGGVNCSARSMARWMAFLLADGVNEDGERLISTQQMKQLFSPVTLTRSRSYLVEHAGSFLTAYALGWNVSTFYGQPIYSHGGGLWGMTSYIAVLPDQDLAVFASNNLMSGAPLAVVNDILHQFLEGAGQDRTQDWVSIVHDAAKTRTADAETEVAEASAARAADSRPSLPLDRYVGTYRDPWYGDIQISRVEDGQLWFSSERSETLEGSLEHFQYDTFIARWVDRGLNADAYVSFTLNPEGGVERIRMEAVSPATDFSFDFHDLNLVRVAPAGE